MPVVSLLSRSWLYVRDRESVRVVVDGAAVDVYGPGPQFSHSQFADSMDAALQHAALEEALVRQGYTLERLITERRSGPERRRARRGSDRRRGFELVRREGGSGTQR